MTIPDQLYYRGIRLGGPLLREKSTPDSIIDATPELRAAMLMVRENWHPKEMEVALRRSSKHVYRLIGRVREFLDSPLRESG